MPVDKARKENEIASSTFKNNKKSTTKTIKYLSFIVLVFIAHLVINYQDSNTSSHDDSASEVLASDVVTADVVASEVVVMAPAENTHLTQGVSVASEIAFVAAAEPVSVASEVAAESESIDPISLAVNKTPEVTSAPAIPEAPPKLITWGEFRAKNAYGKASLAKKQLIYQQFIDEILPQNALITGQNLETVQNEFRAIVPIPTEVANIPESKKVAVSEVEKLSRHKPTSTKGVLTWWEFQRHIVFETLSYRQQQNAYDYFVNTVVPHNALLMGKNRQEAVSAFRAAVSRP